MRKTHQSALALKQALIQELQDIIAEKDEIINTKLRNSQADDVNTKPCLSESQVLILALLLQYSVTFTHVGALSQLTDFITTLMCLLCCGWDLISTGSCDCGSLTALYT